MIIWSIILLIVLLTLSALFSCIETAYTSLSPGQVNALVENQGRRGLRVKKLTQRSDILLTTLLIGNNLTNLGASALTAAMTIQLIGNAYIAVSTGLLTLVVLIFCEVSPKQIAMTANENLCLRSAWCIIILSWLLRPFIWFICTISHRITVFFVGQTKKKLTLDALLHHIKAAEYEGIVESYEEEMIRNVFRINDTPVEAIMTHRTELFTVDEETSVQEALEGFLKSGHSRAPVLRSNSEHVSGVVSLAEVIATMKDAPDLPIKHIISPPSLVPGTMKAHELFFRFKKEPIHLAVVLDEYSGLNGVVTREDIMEEIFGELYDEIKINNADPIRSDKHGAWIIQGDANFYDMSDVLGLHLEHSNRTYTIGGYLLEKLGHIPEPGTEIELLEGRYIILEISNKRISTVRFHPVQKKDG